jgi:hypothetical protein
MLASITHARMGNTRMQWVTKRHRFTSITHARMGNTRPICWRQQIGLHHPGAGMTNTPKGSKGGSIMKEAFETENDVIEQILTRIKNIWNDHGYPEPLPGASTEAHTGITMADYYDMGPGATEEDADNYNLLIEAVFRTIDFRYIGSGIWYTQYESTDEWDGYIEESLPEIQDFINHELWDRYCQVL